MIPQEVKDMMKEMFCNKWMMICLIISFLICLIGFYTQS